MQLAAWSPMHTCGLTFLPLVEDGRTRVVLADLFRVRVHLTATLMDAFLGHVGPLALEVG